MITKRSGNVGIGSAIIDEYITFNANGSLIIFIGWQLVCVATCVSIFSAIIDYKLLLFCLFLGFIVIFFILHSRCYHSRDRLVGVWHS